MMCKYFISLAAMATVALSARGAEPTDAAKVPHKVANVTVENLSGNSVTLPNWGEKNMVIFYIDPDNFTQNSDFQDEYEASGKGQSANLFSFGIVNKYDSAIPLGWIRSKAKKRTEKNGGTALIDIEGVVASQWKLGDCNNKFVLLVISKDGELVFVRKGKLTDDDKAQFYKVIEQYR